MKRLRASLCSLGNTVFRSAWSAYQPAGISRSPSPVVPDRVLEPVETYHLKEMVVIVRGEAEAVGVRFHPSVSYPINWTI